MKKVVIVFIALLALGISARADGLNQSQIKLRDEVKSFLREEGFMPELDSDGDIIFKKEGNNFWITIVSEVTSPMLLILGTGYNNPEGFDSNTIKLASAELNFYKGVKVLCYPDSFVIESEMFLMQVDQFKYAFYVLMAQIASVQGDFYSACEKVNESVKSNSGNTSKSYYASRDVVVSYPKVSSKGDTRAYIKKVTINDSYTIIEMVANNSSATGYYQWCNIDMNTYIQVQGNKYKLLRAEGIKIAPEKTYYSSSNQDITFSLYFPPISKTTTSLDLIESLDSAWRFYGISLR